jgi:peptide/nickel transport system ATP-binding protein
MSFPNKEKLLDIKDLSVEYRTGGFTAKAVNSLSLSIYKGQAVGLVGESGAGKTTTALSILGLLPERIGFVTGGDIVYNGSSLLGMREAELSNIRGSKISMVFANPLTSLNPVFTIGHQIAMGLRRHKFMSETEARKAAADILNLVGIPEYRLDDYPHQFSGGMRQRVGIAAAMVCSPELLIADEPTTALDVTIQAQILELMRNLQKEFSSSLLMITHNLGIIAELCQVVAVMYGGEIVEYGTVKEVFHNPQHPYTVGLLSAIPKITGERQRLASIPGLVANARMLPEGCKFHPRCAKCSPDCRTRKPTVIRVNEDHIVYCLKCEQSHD